MYSFYLYRINKNIKMCSFKSSENIEKTEGGPDRSVSDIQSCSVTLNELAMKAKITDNEGQNNIMYFRVSAKSAILKAKQLH